MRLCDDCEAAVSNIRWLGILGFKQLRHQHRSCWAHQPWAQHSTAQRSARCCLGVLDTYMLSIVHSRPARRGMASRDMQASHAADAAVIGQRGDEEEEEEEATMK